MQAFKPIILDYYLFEDQHQIYFQKPYEAFKVNCSICKAPVKASIRVTSNWISHVKNHHQEEYSDYLKKSAKGIRRKIKVINFEI